MATDTIVIQPKRATATQLVWAGEGPTLIINSDLVNTVYVGNTDSINASNVSGIVPIAPNGSIAVDGTLDYFGVISNTSPPVTVYTVAGGMSTFLGLTQGGGNLAIPGIQSPNFVSNISGWQIQQNGNAQFNNLTIRGTFFGLDFIINSSGIFIYSGTPALGNLVGSWAPVAGNDSFGNAYMQDFTTYNPGTSGKINVNRNAAAGGNTGVLFYAPGATKINAAVPTQVSGRATNTGAVNEVEILQLTSGQSSSLFSADLALFSESADTTIPAQMQATLAGALMWTLLPTQWNVNIPISCTLGTPTTPSVITNGGYTRIASPFSNGWVSGGGGTDANGIIYRMLNDGNYEVWFDIINPAAQVNSVITNLPAPFRPQKNFKHEIAGSIAGCVWIQQNTNGDLVAVGNTAANAEINGRCVFPYIAIP